MVPVSIRLTTLVSVSLALVLSGCVFPFGEEEDSGADAIVKKIVLDVDTDRFFDADDPFDLVSTSFEYTHSGADVPVADVTVKFLERNEREVERPLSRYTSADTLRAGDVVTVTGAHFTSHLTVMHGTSTLADRAPLDADWYTAEGYPLPLAATRDGTLRYSLESDAGFSVDIEDVVIEEEVYSYDETVVPPRTVSLDEFSISGDFSGLTQHDYVSFEVTNDGTTAHALEIEGPDGTYGGTMTIAGGDSDWLYLNLWEPGTYTYYCPVAGHRGLGMSGSFTVAEYIEPEPEIVRTVVDRLKTEFDATTEGTIDVTTEDADGRPALIFGVDVGVTFDGLFDVVYSEDDAPPVNVGASLDGTGDLLADATLTFDTAQRLREVAMSGSVFSDGTLTAWDEDHPRSEGWEPDDMEHPWIDESWDEREEVGFGDGDLDQEALEFMERLWSMPVAVGDELRFRLQDGEAGATIDAVLQVTARDTREVAGKTLDTLRIYQRLGFEFADDDGASDYEVFEFTHWITQDTYVPVHMQASYARTFDRDDFEQMYGSLDEAFGGGVSMPEDANLVMRGQSLLTLTSHSGDLTIPPVFGASGVGVWMLGFLVAMSSMWFYDDWEDDGSYECYWDDEMQAEVCESW